MHRHILVLVALVLVFARETACAQAYGLTTRPNVAAYLDGVMPTEPPAVSTNWSVVVAFPSLRFDNAMGLLPLPGTTKLVVWEREGRVFSFENNAATATKTQILDLSAQCQGWDDMGMLGIAFHPNFATNRHVYVWYNWITPGTVVGSPTTRPANGTVTRLRLARYTYIPATGLLDPASEFIVIDQIDRNTWHNGGGMFFHPVNGFLYLTNGNDNNGAYDQVINRGLFGGVLRIDVDMNPATSHPPVKRAFEEVSAGWPNNYYIPNDNPFVGVAGALEEFFALGLRSPHRMTIDPVTNRIFIGDVGGGSREEIDVIEPSDPGGLNFQWAVREGYAGDLTGTYIGVNKRPILDYPHGGTGGNAVIGGYVYRGTQFPELVGKYLFCDNTSQRIWYMDESTHTTITPSAKLIPYALNQPFWSDGAIKSRWATVPNATTIGFNATGEWTWPAGSVLVKHFDLPADDNDPAIRKRLETRLLVKMASGAVYGASYKWRADNSDADLMDSAITENIPIAITPPGTFTGANLGTPAQPGSTSRVGDEITITAGGTDIWGASDQGYFTSQSRTGDFDISVRVSSLTQPDLYTKVGLMARESLAAGSRHVFAMVFPSNAARNNNVGGYEFQYRTATGGASAAIYPAAPQPLVNYPNTWLRLQRQGNTFIAHNSVDGVWWAEFARLTMNLPPTVFFGIAATSHTATAQTTAKVLLQSTRLQPWYFPSRNDCITCHTANSGGVLGPKTRQLNGDLLFPNAVTDNQLRAWAHIGLFDSPPAEAAIPNLDKLAALDDTTASLEKRARSYLDANCASCHRPGGAQAFWDARFDTPLAQQGLIYGAVGDTLGDPAGRVIMPQSLAHSILFQRGNDVGSSIQMPPLAKNMIDQVGMAVIAEWINSLPINTAPVVTLTAPANGAVYLPFDTINLSATASDADGIQRVEFYDGGGKIGEDFSEPYQLAWEGAAQGMHWLTAVAIDNVGNNSVSATATISVQGGALPAPWLHSDIGNTTLGGDAVYENSGFSITGSGDDIWGTADAFHFIHRAFTGDGEVIARVASLQNTNVWAKAGVMMRETLDANSRYAFSMITGANGASYQMRAAPGGEATMPAQVAGIVAPHWVRLVRAGTNFSSYRSPDGVAWTQIGTTQTIAMGATIYAGIAVTSHDNAQLSESVMSNVAFISAASPAYSVKVNFQLETAAIPAGYLPDGGHTFGLRTGGLSYGWNRDNTPDSRERNSANAPDQRYDTLVHFQKDHGGGSTTSAWEIALPNARYQVRFVAGDPDNFDTHVLTAEGAALLNGTTNAANRFIDATGAFTVTDGRLTIATAAGAVNAKASFVEITSYDVAANIAPTVAVSNPVTGSSFYAPASLTLNALASDPDTALTQVEFLVNGAVVGTDIAAPYSVIWNAPPQGTHAITARATDAAGAVNVSQPASILIKPPNVAPTISLTAPASGFASFQNDALLLTASAADSDGSIAGVEFWADGVKLGTVTVSPYTWNWPGPRGLGPHTLSATAIDDAGASTASAPATVQTMPLTLTPASVQQLTGPDRIVATLRTTLPAGRTYIIEWSADLVTWTTLQSGTSNGTQIEIIDTTMGITQRFYRTRVTN